MPELPEVETVRRGLAPVFEGADVRALDLRRPDLRFPFAADFAARLVGSTVTALGRRAKYLLADTDRGDVLVMHLGMSGSFRVEEETPGAFHHPRGKNPVHDHVVFDLAGPGGRVRVVYNDPRRFGFMLVVPRAELEAHPLFARMGVEPLGNALDGALIARLFAGARTPLKAALLDQHRIAGLGNIYVCEALWRAKLSPLREAGTLARPDGRPVPAAGRLATAIRDVLTEAIAAGGSTLRDHTRTDGSLGYFQHRFAVYDREGEPCPRPSCSGVIGRTVQSGRSTFFCPVCQA